MNELLDKTNAAILNVLQSKGRLANQDIAEQVGISAAACWRRIRALEKEGVISGYTALLNRKAMDLNFCAFLHVTLVRHESHNVDIFEESMLDHDEVLECHATTGDADFLLKVVTKDIEHYDRFLKEALFSQPGIHQVRSNITLREIKSGAKLPVYLASS